MAKKRRAAAGGKGDLRRHIVARAVVDPTFRRRLFNNPENVFGHKLQRGDAEALERIKKMVPALDDIVSSLAGEVLCGGGGGCGGLA
ncbi:MAG: hypothetical protein WB764_00020 [Xanthobacteraceae bacterium]